MMTTIPQTGEEGASWAILEWSLNAGFEPPICASPYFHTPIVGLRCEELPNWVPANTLDKALVEVKVSH